MKLRFAVGWCLLILFSGYCFSDHEFKFDEPIRLVDYTGYPREPEIAWTGSNFAIVYHDYNWGTSCGVYLLFVDPEGNIINGPTRISSQTYALNPKIVWTGTEFVILYAAGSALNDLSYYMERYDSEGNKISQSKLLGTVNHYYGFYSKLIWMKNRKELGIFYRARPLGKEDIKILFCKADKAGKVGEILQQFKSSMRYFNPIWKGDRFVAFNPNGYVSKPSYNVGNIMLLDADGKKLAKEKAYTKSAAVSECNNSSLIPVRKKNAFLLIVSGIHLYDGAASVESAYWRQDYFAGSLSLNKDQISPRKLKNRTLMYESGWRHPSALIVGGKYFVVGGHGCGIVVAEVTRKGAIIGEPLYYSPSG